jgi:hypothetical protein
LTKTEIITGYPIAFKGSVMKDYHINNERGSTVKAKQKHIIINLDKVDQKDPVENSLQTDIPIQNIKQEKKQSFHCWNDSELFTCEEECIGIPEYIHKSLINHSSSKLHYKSDSYSVNVYESNDTKKLIKVFGNFCSIGCMIRYVSDRKLYTKYKANIIYMYKNLIDTTYSLVPKNYELPMAPEVSCLKKFGGTLSIEEYRNTSSENVYHYIKFPMYHSRDVISKLYKNGRNM